MDSKPKIKQVSKIDYRVIKWLTILSVVILIIFTIVTFIITFVRLSTIVTLNFLLYVQWPLNGIFVLLFLIFLSWFLYLSSYKKVLTKKINDSKAISLFYTMKITYFIAKWITLGFWLTIKYDYRKQMGIK